MKILQKNPNENFLLWTNLGGGQIVDLIYEKHQKVLDFKVFNM